jgi:hypothetical protein
METNIHEFTIDVDGNPFTVIASDYVARRFSFQALEEHVRLGMESVSEDSVSIFSTLVDRRVKATYNMEKQTVSLEQSSFLF